MHATVHHCPGNLARVFALKEEGGVLGAGKAEDLEEARSKQAHGLKGETKRTLESPRTKSLPFEG